MKIFEAATSKPNSTAELDRTTPHRTAVCLSAWSSEPGKYVPLSLSAFQSPTYSPHPARLNLVSIGKQSFAAELKSPFKRYFIISELCNIFRPLSFSNIVRADSKWKRTAFLLVVYRITQPSFIQFI